MIPYSMQDLKDVYVSKMGSMEGFSPRRLGIPKYLTQKQLKNKFPTLARYPGRAQAELQGDEIYGSWCRQAVRCQKEDAPVLADDAASLQQLATQLTEGMSIPQLTKEDTEKPWLPVERKEGQPKRKWTWDDVEGYNKTRHQNTPFAMPSSLGTSVGSQDTTNGQD